MGNEKQYQSIIQQKCSQCYLHDDCMLTPMQRAVMCLGPFKDLPDRLEKIKADNQKDAKPKADMRRYASETALLEYLANRMIFDHWEKKDKPDEDK